MSKSQIGQSASGAVKQIIMTGTVIRADGTREELGVISYYHRNPFYLLWFKIKLHFLNPNQYHFLRKESK